MADLSDVENSIVALVNGALYPMGPNQDSVVDTICRVYRGWPSPANLNSDLALGNINVSVLPASSTDEVLAIYLDEPRSKIVATALVASVAGQQVTFSGLSEEGQNVGLLIDRIPFSYRVVFGDTPASVAANLSVLIGQARIATLSGSTVSIPGAASIAARVVGTAVVSRNLRRQCRDIQISCWCPSTALRDSVCKVVDNSLAMTSLVDLSDGTKSRIHYLSTQIHDQSQNALLFRRDLCYKCEYSTIGTTTAPVMLFGDLRSKGVDLIV